MDIGSLSLRPFGASQAGSGEAGAFAAFAGGAGVALKKTQEASSAAATSGEKKGARSQASNAERANRDEIKKYTSEFLMKFAERYNRLPTELQFTSGNLEIIIDEKDENQRDAQRKLLQKVAGIDGDNWAHHKDEKKGGGKGKGAGKRGDSSGNKGDDKDSAHKIQRASDLGRTAWAAGAEEGSKQQGLRKMKGILNKLTPEKFERLLGQLIPLITSHEVLEGTITMVFENAVVQPTFVAMYANLCAELDSILPEFAGKDGKPESFRKMLANTCQEEYESTEFEMKNAERASGAVENKEVQARAKNRLIGNVRLIAELFKKALVNDRIMLLILSDLLGPAENNPAEDWLEAACELVAIAGEKLEASPRSKARLDAIFEHFKRLTNTSSYAPRIRFVVKDVVDLRAQNWVARRETYTAKKLDEIRTEAQAELGIVDVEIPGLTPLGMGGSSGGVGGAGGVGKKTEDVELFPKFKGNLKAASAEDAASEKFTSLLGQFVPISETTEADRCVLVPSLTLSRRLLSARPRRWGAAVYIMRRAIPCISPIPWPVNGDGASSTRGTSRSFSARSRVHAFSHAHATHNV